MLSYELAKELKENGFPQKELYRWNKDTHPKATIEEYRYFNVGIVRYEGYYCPALTNEEVHTDEDDIYIPTLSELIETFDNEGLFSLHQIKNNEHKWYARIEVSDDLGHNAFGNSAEEAVANLWLYINKK